MFEPQQRAELRSALLELAREDSRLSAAAITGSAASGTEDEWSDVDLALSVREGDDVQAVLGSWTARMYTSHQALHHLDVHAGAWIYRVFLLANALQVDLAFVPAAEFRALAPTFRLVFGEAKDAWHIPPPAADGVIGMGWLYALHARSSIARGKFWEAEYMISGVRDHALMLACLRHGLPAAHGRGYDRLPAEVTGNLLASLVGDLTVDALSKAFASAVNGLLAEIRLADSDLAERLEPTLRSFL